MALFDSEFLKKLEYLALVSRGMSRGRFFDRQRKKRVGAGLEFAEHRDYSPGDDLRSLDWNVYARLGTRQIKRFEEEEDLCVYFLLDCSRSMDSGHPNKFDYARRTAAALSYIALDELDRVCVAAFDSEIRRFFPLTRGKENILALLDFLERLEIGGAATDLAAVARDFLQRRLRRGPTVILGDLFDPNGWQTAVDALRFERCDPRILEIHDAEEATPTRLGDWELHDAETGAQCQITVTEAVLARYRKRFTAWLNQLRQEAAQRSVPCSVTRTDLSFEEFVLQILRENK